VIAACLKWVDRRPEWDPATSQVITDARTSGLSAPDAAALELALRCGDAWSRPVAAVTAGPPAAEDVLREAIAAGAVRAVRVDLPATSPSNVVASALAGVLADLDATSAWCGDHSLDRGSGSVPAYLAAELARPQALGLVEVSIGGSGEVSGLRRLDRGRRERLAVAGGAVLSVEGSAARLRRAPLAAAMAARSAPIEVRVAPAGDPVPAKLAPGALRLYRPRARVWPAPDGDTALDRIADLTATGMTKGRPETVILDPAAAAERILEALAAWGYDVP